MSDFEPFYDVSRSYEDNYEQGPFGAFAEALKDGNGADAAGTTSEGASEGALATFLGQPVNLPFGIPAGPLLNSRFTTAAFRMGFDLATYKTVRSRAWGCNPFPNVLAVHPKSADGSLTPGSAELDEGVLADTNYETPISISNSFGVPSQSPDVWQPDMRAAIEAAGPGQVLVPSFQGSRVEGMSEEEYIADHATTARLVKETGAKLMVMNTSCPNEGHNRLLCHNPLLVGRITEAVKQEIGDIPLMVKLAYIPSDGDLELMVRSTVGHGTVQGFSTINTISAKLADATPVVRVTLLKNIIKSRIIICSFRLCERVFDILRINIWRICINKPDLFVHSATFWGRAFRRRRYKILSLFANIERR